RLASSYAHLSSDNLSDFLLGQAVDSQSAQAAIRAFANRTGRARLRSDASEMVRTYPRGMLLATGEESPGLQSTLARLLTIELSRTDIDKAKLTVLQGQAHR